MKLYRYFYLTLCVCAALSLGSCRRPIDGGGDEPDVPVEPVDPLGPGEFRLDISGHDGIRNLSQVMSRPVLNLSLRAEDELESFTFSYTVNGGVRKFIHELYDKSEKKLQLDVKDYGSYVVKGYLYPDADVDNRIQVDTVLWMKYESADVSEVVARTTRRSVDLLGGESLVEGESGSLVLFYMPENTFVTMKCASSDASVLWIDESDARNTGGMYTVDFKALKPGNVKLIYSTTNGPDKGTVEVPVTIEEDSDGKAVYVSLSTDTDLYLSGSFVAANVCGESGKPQRRFDVSLSVDGNVVKSVNEVMLSKDMILSFSSAGLSIGVHKLLATVVPSDGMGVTVTSECTFYVAAPVVSVETNSYNTGSDGPVYPLELDVRKEYTFALSGVPEMFLDRFSFNYAAGDYYVSGSGPWLFVPEVFGRGDIHLEYALSGKRSRLLTFNVLRKDVYPLTLSWEYEAEAFDRDYKVKECALKVTPSGRYVASMSVDYSGSINYYGYCEYPVHSRVEKTGDYVNERHTDVISRGEHAIRTTVPSGSQSFVLANLLNKAIEIASNSMECSYWTTDAFEEHRIIYDSDLGPHSYLATEYFHYDLIVDKLHFGILSNYEGLTFEVTLSGINSDVIIIETNNIKIK